MGVNGVTTDAFNACDSGVVSSLHLERGLSFRIEARDRVLTECSVNARENREIAGSSMEQKQTRI